MVKCMYNMPTNQPESWEKEFDERYVLTEGDVNNFVSNVTPKRIKPFITKVRTEAIQGERRRIEEIIEKAKFPTSLGGLTMNDLGIAFNLSLDQVLQALRGEDGEG